MYIQNRLYTINLTQKYLIRNGSFYYWHSYLKDVDAPDENDYYIKYIHLETYFKNYLEHNLYNEMFYKYLHITQQVN